MFNDFSIRRQKRTDKLTGKIAMLTWAQLSTLLFVALNVFEIRTKNKIINGCHVNVVSGSKLNFASKPN